MDLQAILDATDSSSSDGDDEEMYSIPALNLGGGGPPLPPPQLRMETPPRYSQQQQQQQQQQGVSPASAISYSPHHPSSSSKVDLEQILREDDDDDSSTDELTSYQSSAYETKEKWSSASFASSYNTTTNPEEWDVLQAILGEDDESSSDKADDDELLSSSYSHKPSAVAVAATTAMTGSNPSSLSVNLILQQSEDEFDFYSHGKEEKTSFSYLNTSNDAPLEEKERHGVDSFVTAKESRDDDMTKEDYFTLAALKYAQTYEKKLFKSGHRDIVSPLQVKRRLKPKIELNTRLQQQQQKQQQQQVESSTAAAAVNLSSLKPLQKQSKFNFSGTVEDKKLAILSQTMTDFSASVAKRTKNKKTALPTALAVNARYLAIGLQTGIILAFDLFESLRQKLGLHDTDQFQVKMAGSVTSIDLSLQQGEFLVAGYTSGSVVLWDTIKGIPLKSVIETTPSPITSVRFLADLKVVSVDAGGLVNKLGFSKVLLWNAYSVESECLLDGTAGQILAMNVLPPFSFHATSMQNQQKHSYASGRKSHIPSLLKKIVLIALSSERSSFAVAVEPKVHVLHRWAKPPPERMNPSIANDTEINTNQVYLPCLSWGWALVSGGENTINPILARAWGCCLQLLRANFPEEPSSNSTEEVYQWPAFGVHDEFDVSAPVVALEWLNDRSLIYLSVNNEFTVIDTVMMTLLERLDFSGLKLVYAEFSLSRKQQQQQHSNMANDDDYVHPREDSLINQFCTTFENSVRSCDNRLLFLCQDELKSVSIVGAKKRISGLEQDGEWLEALALALDHYENTVKSQEDRLRKRRRKNDLSRHASNHNRPKSEDEEWIAKLLVRYLNIAVENAPSPNEVPLEFQSSQLELAQSHFQMLAGVCIEFCVTTKRLDLLFGPIFARFSNVGYLSVFLDVLEPYILNDKLDYIAPEAMAHFVEHCKATNGIATVERCLLHMDVTIMDFDTILGLLKANQMYSALFYVFNQGLDDYTTPLEILAEQIMDAADTQIQNKRRPDGVPQNKLERYGYKALLYLQSCFQGKFFPQDADMPNEKLSTVRPQLLKFLLREVYSPSHFTKIKKKRQVFGQRSFRYPYTHILLSVDPRAMFDTMSLAMNAPDEEFGKLQSSSGDLGEWQETSDQLPPQRSPERQDIMQMFMSILFPKKNDSTHQSTLHQSKPVVDAFLDFLAEYLVKGVVQANRSVTFLILERMADKYQQATTSQEKQDRQKQILQLLTALPRNSYDSDEILTLMQGTEIHRAALLMHQEGASYWEGSRDLEKRAGHFRAAIDCYLGDADVDFRKEVFAYVKKECNAADDDDDDDLMNPYVENTAAFDESPITMRDALASKLTDLVQLNPLLTAELVAELFVEDMDRVILTLKNEDARFKFLQAIISGKLDEMDSVAGAVLNSHLTMEHHHKYLALMTKLHPELVYEYLSSHDNYRPDECLKLCQRHEIADASAYLLERMGNVSSALQLILQTLESRMMNLKRTIRGVGTDFIQKFHARRSPTSHHRFKKFEFPSSESHQRHEKEIEGVKRILVVALDVCERNSGTFSSRPTEHGSQLWFNVLDRLINAKGFLRLSKEQPAHAKVMAGVLSDLLRMTMQRMVSSVPLPDLVRKVTSDHSGSRLGELREMIESLLVTYGLELHVFGKAVSIFQYDSQQMQKMNHSIRVKGSHIHTVMNVPLTSKKSRRLQLPSENGEILQLAERGNASVIDADLSLFSPGNKKGDSATGLGNALSRLRFRRPGNKSKMESNSNSAAGLNLMTTTDILYRQGEVSPEAMYFEDRLSGMLGDAEHRGRLMSFMY